MRTMIRKWAKLFVHFDEDDNHLFGCNARIIEPFLRSAKFRSLRCVRDVSEQAGNGGHR